MPDMHIEIWIAFTLQAAAATVAAIKYMIRIERRLYQIEVVLKLRKGELR